MTKRKKRSWPHQSATTETYWEEPTKTYRSIQFNSARHSPIMVASPRCRGSLNMGEQSLWKMSSDRQRQQRARHFPAGWMDGLMSTNCFFVIPDSVAPLTIISRKCDFTSICLSLCTLFTDLYFMPFPWLWQEHGWPTIASRFHY